MFLRTRAENIGIRERRLANRRRFPRENRVEKQFVIKCLKNSDLNKRNKKGFLKIQNELRDEAPPHIADLENFCFKTKPAYFF